MQTILSFDPGAEISRNNRESETGISYLAFSDTEPPCFEDYWSVPNGFDGLCQWLREHPKLIAEADIVVVEKYVVFNKDGNPSPLLGEGVIRFLRPDCVLSPSSGKNTAVPDQILKDMGLYVAGGHHRDVTESARHAVRYLKNQAHIPTLNFFRASV